MRPYPTYFKILVLALCSCNKDRLSNLTFPDAERQFIKKHRIDTTYVFYPQENGSEIKTYQTYNEDGQVVYDNTSMIGPRKYFYDKRGLLIKEEGVTSGGGEIVVDSMMYDLDENDRRLTRKWLDRFKKESTYNDRGREEKFIYDDNGRITEMIEIRNFASGPTKKRTTYAYEGDLLKRVSVFRSNSSTLDAEIFYYYSDQIIDSVVLKLANSSQPPFRFIYKNGLIAQKFHGSYPGQERYVHTIRK